MPSIIPLREIPKSERHLVPISSRAVKPPKDRKPRMAAKKLIDR